MPPVVLRDIQKQRVSFAGLNHWEVAIHDSGSASLASRSIPEPLLRSWILKIDLEQPAKSSEEKPSPSATTSRPPPPGLKALTMKSLFVLGTLLLASAFSSCSSVTTVAYSNGTIASSEVDYTFSAPQVFRTGRGMRYFVSIEGAPSWEKISIASLQSSGMGRTAERERAKLLLFINVGPLAFSQQAAIATEGGFSAALETSSWYQIRYDNADGQEVSGSSAEYIETMVDPSGTVFATEDEAKTSKVFTQRSLSDPEIRQLQANALAGALEEADQLGQRLFSAQDVSLSVPAVSHAAGVELEDAFNALTTAESRADLTRAESLYQTANDELDARSGDANATSRYGVLCGLATCRLMLNDFAGAWDLTTQALRLEPDGAEAQSIRNGIYQEELRTGLREIPMQDRKAMDQQAAREGSGK